MAAPLWPCLPCHTAPCLVGICVSLFSSCKDAHLRIGAHPPAEQPPLNVIASARTLFPDQVLCSASGGWDLETAFRGLQFCPYITRCPRRPHGRRGVKLLCATALRGWRAATTVTVPVLQVEKPRHGAPCSYVGLGTLTDCRSRDCETPSQRAQRGTSGPCPLAACAVWSEPQAPPTAPHCPSSR